MNEFSIFDYMYPKFKIDKPIRLITLFSGYDSQALALKYLGIPFEHYKTCEWAIKSIQALKDMHFDSDNNDYSASLDIDDVKKWLLDKGISSNYNDPLNEKQINRMSEKYARTIFNNIIATHNLVNIQKVKGRDLEIKNTDIYIYICTYSFPCQDLSLAGKGKGMSDTNTRSGMLWEVERILTELEEKPQILLMENVPQVHSQDNVKDFHKWQLRLEELGYKNYMQDLIATDYGIPQIRNRCFMVSILGDYSYSFPKKQELKLKLKDMLEDKVDEKYYLSEAMIKYVTKNGEIDTQNNFEVIDSYNKRITNENYSGCIVSGQGRNQGSMLMEKSEDNVVGMIPQWHQRGKIYNENKNAPTICSTDYKTTKLVAIKNATSKGYLEAEDGDGVDISARMQYHRGTVQKGKIQSLTCTGGKDLGVVVNEN